MPASKLPLRLLIEEKVLIACYRQELRKRNPQQSQFKKKKNNPESTPWPFPVVANWHSKNLLRNIEYSFLKIPLMAYRNTNTHTYIQTSLKFTELYTV